MTFPIKAPAKACRARKTNAHAEATPTLKSQQLDAIPATLGACDASHPEMERRMKPQAVWEFLDESKSTFYERMDPKKPSFDPLFPRAIPSSSKGIGPKRWKFGAVIAWLRICEANADTNS